jgi:predicted amidohydrolase
MRVTCVQLAITDRPKKETTDHVLGLLDQTRGSDLVLLPELWPCGFFAFDRYAADAEPISGPLVQSLRQKARQLGIHLLTGSFVERDGPNLYNTVLLVDPNGEIRARFRKIHLFGMNSREKELLRPGTEVTVVSTPWGKAGFAICYDLRFPELFRRMADLGAELFMTTSAWPQPREEAWVLLNRARAVENLAYVFACNAAGTIGERHYLGRSLIVDPYGAVVADGGRDEGLVTADVDLGRVAESRRTFPFLADRVFRQEFTARNPA